MSVVDRDRTLSLSLLLGLWVYGIVSAVGVRVTGVMQRPEGSWLRDRDGGNRGLGTTGDRGGNGDTVSPIYKRVLGLVSDGRLGVRDDQTQTTDSRQQTAADGKHLLTASAARREGAWGVPTAHSP